MDEIGLFFSTKGRIGRRAFGWCLLAVYLAGFFSQALLSGNVIARVGLMPFILVQVGLIWAWLALHIKRLRDANEGPAGAIGVAIVYSLAVGLVVLIVSVFTGFAAPSGAERPPGAPTSPGDAALALFFILLIVSLLYSGDLGTFGTLLKILLLIACLPGLISFVFSLRTGLRHSAASTPLPPPAPFVAPKAAPPPPAAKPPA